MYCAQSPRFADYHQLDTMFMCASGDGGVIAPITYVLRDCFVTSQSAPIVGERACEPGPGTVTVVDVEGDKVHIDTGAFTVDVLDTPGYARAGFYFGSAPPFYAGLALFSDIPNPGLESSFYDVVGFGALGLSDQASKTTGFKEDGACIYDSSGVENDFPIESVNGKQVCVVIGDGQTFWFVNGDIVYMVNDTPYTSYYYPQLQSYAGECKISSISEVDLVAEGRTRWEKSFARVTDSLSAPATGAAFTMEADSGECTYTYTGESGKNVNVWLRYTDANNRIYIYGVSDGSTFIVKKVGGIGTNLYVGSGLADGSPTEYTVTIKDDKLSVWRNQVTLVDEADVSDVPKIDACRCTHNLATNDIALTTHPLDLGVATSRSIYPQVGDTQGHTNDVFLDIEGITLASATTMSFDFRYTDASNRVNCVFYADGRLVIYNRHSSGNTTLLNAVAGSVSSGDRVTLRMIDDVLRVYVDNALLGTGTAANHLTGTATNFSYQSDGAISAVTCYPIDNEANLVTPGDCPEY